MRTTVFLSIISVAILFNACSNKQEGYLAQFPNNTNKLVEFELNINSNDLGMVEGLHCSDTLLVVLDYHEQSFSLFSTETGTLISRFGQIGNGDGEISAGCDGGISNNKFTAYSYRYHKLATYCLNNPNEKTSSDIHKYQLDNAMFSRILPTSNNTYLGLGTYNGKYQYVLFDKSNNILDYALENYNAEDLTFDISLKFLSNQGRLVKHPSKDLFAGFINKSANIDFLKVEDNKLNVIKSDRNYNPQYTPISLAGSVQTIPTEEAITGFIDICSTEKYVFALFSDDKYINNPNCSNVILVYDWDGNKVCRMISDKKLYYIASNENCLYLVEQESSGSFVIKGAHYYL